MNICAFPECGRVKKAKGLCNGHDLQRRKGHDLMALGKHALPADARFWVHVEKTDTCWIWTGAKDHNGYGKLRINGRTLAAHRISFERSISPISAGQLIDHTCHTPACVNPSHLRVATTKQNMENRAGPQKGSKSGVRGVSWHSASARWTAAVGHYGKKHYLGLFDTVEAAAEAVLALMARVMSSKLLAAS